MFGNTFFTLTTLIYLAIVGVNLYKPSGSGERLVGWGFIIFGILIAYVLCSLLLTVNLAYSGKFNWISTSKGTRNLAIGAGYLCLTAGVVIVTMINVDGGNPNTLNWLGQVLLRFGAIWLPLLMLVPFAILLKTEGQVAIVPAFCKIALLLGCLIGLFFFVFPRQQMGKIFRNQKAIIEQEYHETMSRIGSEWTPTMTLLQFLDSDDARIRAAALERLKSKKDLDKDLVFLLNNCESNKANFWVINFLEEHKVEQPEMFVEPLNLIIQVAATEIKYRLQSFGDENGFLELLNVDGLCRVLNGQFKAFKADFRPSMIKLRAELEVEPKPDFLKIRNEYLAAVQDWLDAD
jgi:hypothetical protein